MVSIKKIKKSMFIAAIVVLMGSQVSFYAKADNAATGSKNASNIESNQNTTIAENKYSSYLNNAKIETYSGSDILLSNMSDIAVNKEKLETNNNSLVARIEQGEEASFKIQAPKAGLYQIGINYLIDNKNILPTQLSMTVNGGYPFYELRNLVFESRWKAPNDIPKDRYGNEIVPEAFKVMEWQDKLIGDSSYRNGDPFLIELMEGVNEITFNIQEGNILIKSFLLTSPQKLSDYKQAEVKGNEFIQIEGENVTYRNDSSIRAGAEYNVDLTPYSSSKRVLNYLDDNSYKTPGQRIEYEFEVAESGYYYLGMNYRQDAKVDFPVFVHILVDDQIPFNQFKNYPFQYTKNFTNSTVKDVEKENNIPIYLEKGTHKISYIISLDNIKETIERIEFLMSEIQVLSLEITNITGTEIDRNRDINLEEFIPGVEKQLVTWADEFNLLYENMKKFNQDVSEVGAFSALQIAEEQLRSIAEKPKKIPVRVRELSTGSNSITAQLGTLLQAINNNGIAIDKLYFYQYEKDIPEGKNVFLKAFESTKRFIFSFGNQDYSVNNVNDEHLQVWVNRPRQYIEILQKLIDEEFTPKTGIKVDISLMPDQNKLILANASGDAPDVASGVNYALPYEIGIRGALQDLTEFEDYKEVSRRFSTGLLIPGTIGDGVYAIPETMNFWVLFYRKDVLESLNMPVPQTLDEVKSYLPELQRKGKNFFYPTAGMPGMKNFHATMPIIYQNGGQFYGETIGRTALNEENAIKGMRELTELFTIYNMPYEVPSFYQQFRDGSLPLGIADYGMYNLILNAAPEIANSWDISVIPGIENENGEISRWSAGGAESDIIFKDSDMKEAAWEYLKWWTSTETQVTFGNVLQVSYGKEYIWNTANIEAFADLPWITRHKNTILAQAEWLTEVPRVPGSYMLERELSNAYNSIVLDGVNLRTAIDLASKRINRETNRKLEEFGYIKDGVMVKPYPNPGIDNK